MNDLTGFLLARIAEEEGAAREIPLGVFEDACSISRSYEFVFRHDPSRILAECEAKRRIVELHQSWGYVEELSYADNVLRLLALPHADHADYREEWKP